jgi:hypothetical protein
MFKKWFNKQTITVFIMTFVLFNIVPMYAATLQQISVTYNDIKMSINGIILTPDVEPFVYQNRTFVPVRFIAEAFDKDIKYNEITDTVEITDKIIEEEIENMDETLNIKPDEIIDTRRERLPYNSINIELTENCIYENFNTIKYNNNYFITEQDAKKYFQKDFKYSLSKGKTTIMSISPIKKTIIIENEGYIIINDVIYFNTNIEI